jgi:hypothetical protein
LENFNKEETEVVGKEYTVGKIIILRQYYFNGRKEKLYQ